MNIDEAVTELNAKADLLERALGRELPCGYCASSDECQDVWMVSNPCCLFIQKQA